MSEDEDVAAAVSEALAASGIEILENAGTIDRLEPSPAGVRLTYSRDGTAHQIDADDRGRRGRLGRQHRRAQPPRRRRPDRPTRVRAGGRPASHQRAAHLRRRRRHRTRDGRPRSSTRGVPRRDQRGARNHDRPTSRSQPHRELHRPRIRLRRTHRDDGPQDPSGRRRDPAVRLAAPTDHRRTPHRFLQTHRRPSTPHDPRLPHRRRTRRRTRSAGGGRDGSQA